MLLVMGMVVWLLLLGFDSLVGVGVFVVVGNGPGVCVAVVGVVGVFVVVGNGPGVCVAVVGVAGVVCCWN